jgi:hypothetical protein
VPVDVKSFAYFPQEEDREIKKESGSINFLKKRSNYHKKRSEGCDYAN